MPAEPTGEPAEGAGNRTGKKAKRPLYPRLLRLRHVRPNGWQRALLGEGALAVAVVLVLADLASAWTLLVLPLAVAAIVKAHDVLAGLLRAGGRFGPGAAGPDGAGNGDGAGNDDSAGNDDDAGPERGPAPTDAESGAARSRRAG